MRNLTWRVREDYWSEKEGKADIMTDREQLKQLVAQLEAQRAVLGDVAVGAALAGLRQKLAELELSETQWPSQSIPSALAGERRLVTIMFADVSGFTAMSEKMDPEAVRDLMNACFERLVPVIERHNGTVDKFIGDEIMALFGAPVAHENDSEQAIRAALDMTDELAAFNTELGTDLGIHFGINTGLVIAGDLGTRQKQEYSVMGDAVNLASRLGDLSERGQILVGLDTYRMTAPLFEFEIRSPIHVKGKANPVQVYRVKGLKGKAGRVHGLEVYGLKSPLVGREAELAAFTACIERLLNGQGGIISVIGEAGVGKSRLVSEVQQTLFSTLPHSTKRFMWLEGRTLSFGQTISYWPFQEIIRQFAGITEEDDEDTAWAKLEGRIKDLFPDQVVEILPYIASMVALPIKGEYEERVKYLDGEAMGRQIFYTLRRFFDRLAQTQPLVLIFEDLHWIDQSSATLLEHLMPLIVNVPLLICGISRSDPKTPDVHLRQIAAHDYADCYTEIRLEPLSSTDTVQLVHNLLEIKDLSHKAHKMILSKAEGNPFFVEEVIRVLIAIGALVRDPTTGRWQATAQVEHVSIPDTIQGVIMARVDRLNEDVKQVLRIASVIGRSFLYRVLRAIDEADRELDRHIDELQQVELIREKSRVPELEYIFKHALAQETTYESILLQRRRELHSKVANCIETLFTDRVEEFYSLLAYHYARAEDWKKAQEYLFKAGDMASRVAADAEALAHYQQALEAYNLAFGDQWDPLQRAILERKIGEAFFRRGEHEQAVEYLRRALAFLGSPFPTSRWGVRWALAKEIARQVSHRLLPSLLLKTTSKQAGQAIIEERAYIYYIIAWAAIFQERGVLASVTLLNISETSGFSRGIAQGFAFMGYLYDCIGLLGLAGYYNSKATALAEQVRHPAAIGVAYLILGIHEYQLGQWEAASEHSRQAAETYRDAGDLRGWGAATAWMAVVWRRIGNFTNSTELAREVIRVGTDSGDFHILAWGLHHGQGLTQWSAGLLDVEETINHLQRTVELFKVIPDYLHLSWALADLGQCYLHQGKLPQALEVLEEAHSFITKHGLRGYSVTEARNGLAGAYLAVAEQAPGTERAKWLKKAAHACRVALRQGKIDRSGLPEATRLQGRYEWLRGKYKAAQQWWQRSLAIAEESGMHYELGMTHLEMGDRLNDRTHLEQAETILAEIGAKWDLRRAKDALRGI